MYPFSYLEILLFLFSVLGIIFLEGGEVTGFGSFLETVFSGLRSFSVVLINRFIDVYVYIIHLLLPKFKCADELIDIDILR